MITFKRFINESAVSLQPSYNKMEVNAAINMLNKHCKDALWMLTSNSPLYRGFRNTTSLQSGSFFTVDSSATERISENTSNHYTVIFDNNPYMKDWPKRSRSFIGSTSFDRASGYASGHLMIMIPFDDVKIGFVGMDDIWDIQIKLFDRIESVDYFNELFSSLGIEDNIESFKLFDKNLKNGDENTITKFNKIFPKANLLKNGFLEQIFTAYSQKRTGFNCFTTATIPDSYKGHKTNSEIWVSGKVMLIKQKMWQQMIDSL